MKLKCVVFTAVLFLSVGATTQLFADKSSVEITADALAAVGTEVVITVKVMHHGNNFAHHTNWVYVKANGREIARFEYPFESEVFTRTVKYKVTGPAEIEAKANCNLHGSAGEKTVKIKTK